MDGTTLRPAPLGPPLSSRLRGGRLLAAAAILGVLLAGYLALAPHNESADSLRDRVAKRYGQLPLRFEANREQTDPRVDFLSRGPGYTLFLAPTEAVISLAKGSGPAADHSVVRMSLAGASPHPKAQAGERLPGVTNYLTGSDPKRWRTGVPSFAQVRYESVLPGIDVVYHGRQRSLEYDFVVAPGADPSAITLDFSGVRRLTVDSRGDLVAHTAGGSLRQHRPVLYQQVGGKRRAVAGRYVIEGDRVGFDVGAYDRGRPLVIDPVLSYATYLGGIASDTPNAIAVDSNGNAYVAGQTTSSDFPTAGPLQATNAGSTDAFVSKLNGDGAALVYSTYLGGTGNDIARGIALDAGSAVVVGDTTSSGAGAFPTTATAFQPAIAGGTDAFLSRLAANGSSLTYSTYLGGAGIDRARAVAVDSGNAYVTGDTVAATFPTKNPVQGTIGGGLPGSCTTGTPPVATTCTDAFVSKFKPAAATSAESLVYSTFLGGDLADQGNGIAVESGAAYVAGQTASTNFPTTAPFQAANGGSTDAFVTKFNADGSARDYSTYLGGSAADNADGIAVVSGAAYVAGDTASSNFPTASPLQATNGGGGDVFVSKLNAGGAALGYSTFIGGAGSDGANGIAADASGRAAIVGSTSSGDWPSVLPVAAKEGNSDMLAAQLNASGSALNYSTPLGGNASESGTAIAVDGSGTAYLTGSSLFFASGDVATVSPSAPFQPQNRGNNDALVAKIATHDTSAPLVTQLGTRSGPTSGGTTVEITGTSFTGTTAVKFGATAAASFTVNSATKITANSPAHAAGAVPVRVTTAAGTSPANPIARFTYAEGSWTRTGPMVVGRSVFTNTLLENGKVLAAGGRSVAGDSAALTSAELYNPKTGTWTATASMSGSRFGHTATLLRGPECKAASRPAYCGKVLVAGGYTGSSTANAQPVLDTAELFDPATGTWAPAAPLATRRSLHAATLLADGRVLVAGGRTCTAPPPTACDFTNYTNTAEIYNPATNAWTTTGSMGLPRHTTDAALLPNGKVLVPAGFPDSIADSSAVLFDPATGTWASCATTTPTPDCPGPLNLRRARAGATLLPNGKVIVAGGFPNNDTSELWDPETGTWSETGKLTTFGRFNYYSALLPNGKFLLTGGGNGGSSAELYNPSTGTWSSAGVMAEAHGTSSSNANSIKAVVLSSSPDRFASDAAVCGTNCGKVLIVGNTELKAAELYTPFVAASPPTGGGGGRYTVPYPGPSAPFAGCPSASSNLIVGTAGANRLLGTARGDRIFALAGNDTVDGLAGNDCIDLGPGRDSGRGSSGADLILGGTGADRLNGGSGKDRLRGGSSGDRIAGGSSSDRIEGGSGKDRIGGNSGNDSIKGNSGSDRIAAGSGSDRVSAGSGKDRIDGGKGRDRISAGSGDDRISARDGKRDRINCGSGGDRVVADRIDRVSRNCEHVSRRRR